MKQAGIVALAISAIQTSVLKTNKKAHSIITHLLN